MTSNPATTYPVTCPACSKVGNAIRPIPQGVKVRCKCGHSFIPVPVQDAGGFGFGSISLQEAPSAPEVQVSVDESEVGDEEVPLSAADLRAGTEEDRVGFDREATLTDLWNVLLAISLKLATPASVNGPVDASPKEYKVVTQKDKWFSGKFDPEKVEGALNAYAKQGWSLKGVATASVPGFGGQRDEIVIIMER